MSDVLLFGATSPSGLAFLQGAGSLSVTVAGRRRPEGLADGSFQLCDLRAADSLEHPLDGILVSFAPLWDLAPFLARLAEQRPGQLAAVRGVVACSSSSVITKRFAFNSFDRDLVQRLSASQDSLIRTCNDLGLPCTIVAPTLIYGRVGDHGDRNLSQLLQWMRRFPLLPLPADTGLRQPIHASQLAAVVRTLVMALVRQTDAAPTSEIIAVGGDDTLTYHELLLRLQQQCEASDRARGCRLVSMPSLLFRVLAAPLLLATPKGFEAVMRMQVDLAGFLPSHRLVGEDPRPFPVLPV
ncbi:MAG: hypothetical protein NTZ40_05565 [Cyanobacteria bacterium]|jgi:hypothetical protein|nr:hypothetical protein [Cyanobacteriota bacterium]